MDVSNWLKLQLLLDRATTQIREIFKQRWKLQFNVEWEESNTEFLKLIVQKKWYKLLGSIQRKAIATAITNHWDLSTLGIILRNFEFKNLNAIAIKQENENIAVIVAVRNINAHLPTKHVPNSKFDEQWNAVKNALIELGDSADKIDLLRASNSDGHFKIANSVDKTNINKAQKLKEQGNKEFNSNRFDRAVKTYTKAIQLCGIPDNDKAILFCNRSNAYVKLYLSSDELRGIEDLLNHAEEDAQQACRLCPNWSKAYYRLGEIYTTRGQFPEAIRNYEAALALDPENKEIKSARSNVISKLSDQKRKEHLEAPLPPKTMKEVHEDAENEIKYPTKQMSEFAKAKKLTPLEFECFQLCRTAYYYLNGMNTRRDPSKAAMYFSKADTMGFAEGTFKLAKMYMHGMGVQKDIPLAVKMLFKAASMPPFLTNGKLRNLGVAEAQHHLGFCHESGIGVDIDYTKAAEWYRKAAIYLPMAANNLGLMLLWGTGISRDEDAGIRYLKQAANERNPNAMENLADYYLHVRDAMEGLKWIRRAADSGSVYAQVRVKDFEEAVKEEEADFKNSGTEQWEKEKQLPVNNLTFSERMQRRMKFDPFASPFTNVEEAASLSTSYSNMNLEKFRNILYDHAQEGSIMALTMYNAHVHFVKACSLVDNKDTSKLPNLTTWHFVVKMSSAIKLDMFCLPVTPNIKAKSKSVSQAVISKLPGWCKENEAARICYGAFLDKPEEGIPFLTESIQLFPDNYFFYYLRSIAYGSLENFAKSLEDAEAGLKFAPHDISLLYVRADALFHMKHGDGHAAITAFEQYLKEAPMDDRNRPDAYYATAIEYMMQSQFTMMKRYYQWGQEAENSQLPCFLPYESNRKKYLESFSFVSKHSSKLPLKPASRSNGRFEEEIKLILQHRKTVAEKRFVLDHFTYMKPKSCVPVKLIGLMPIFLGTMDLFEDRVYEGYILTVVIIDVPFTEGGAICTLIEDERKQVQRLCINGLQPEGMGCACKKAHSVRCRTHKQGIIQTFIYGEFNVGTRLSIINPFMRLAEDGKPMITVDDISTIRKEPSLVKPCSACISENTTMHCASCSSAFYCSKVCQVYDWKTLNHKDVCFKRK